MALPFSIEQFFDVFRDYNESVWPLQIVLFALAVFAIGVIAFRRIWSDVAASAALAGLWTWTGVAYHLVFFSPINPLAFGFAALSVIGAWGFVWHGLVRRRLHFVYAKDGRTALGLTLVTFALLAYPAWSVIAGHTYPRMPTFGLPCPTTLFTIGLLCCLRAPYPRSVLIAPILWCVIGAQAALLLDVSQDLALAVAGAIGVALVLRSGTAKPSAA